MSKAFHRSPWPWLGRQGRRKLAVAHSSDLSGFMADPQLPIRIQVKAGDDSIAKPWRVAAIKNSESRPIIANQAMVRAEPEITIRRLCDGSNGIMRPIFHRPDIEVSARIKRRNRQPREAADG